MKVAPQIIEKSGLLQKAFNEMADIGERYMFDPTILRELARLQFRSCELIENYIDRPENEKEVLMVAGVFSHLPGTLIKDYGPEGYGLSCEKLFSEMIKQERDIEKTGHPGDISLTLTQLDLVKAVVNLEYAIMRCNGGKFSAEEARHYRKELSKVLPPEPGTLGKSRFGISAARLHTHYHKTCDTLRTTLDSHFGPTGGTTGPKSRPSAS